MRNMLRFLIVVLVLASIVSAIACSSGSQGGTSKNSVAVRMMQILPETANSFGYYDVYQIRTDEKLTGLKGFLDEESIHFIPFDLFEECEDIGFAQDAELMLAKMSVSLDSMIENEDTDTYEYEGFSVWTDQYYSSVLIDGIYVSGSDENIRACIDAVNGKAKSMYDNTKDMVNQLPDSYVLSLGILDSEYHADDGLLMQAESSSIQGENFIQTEIYKLNSVETAQQYNDFSGSYYDEYANPDISREGVFVTVVTTSTSLTY